MAKSPLAGYAGNGHKVHKHQRILRSGSALSGLQPACPGRRLQPSITTQTFVSRRFHTTFEVAWPARYPYLYTARVPLEAYAR